MTGNPFAAVERAPEEPPSWFLTEQDFASLYAAADFASAFELWFDTTVSISWRLMGAKTPKEVASAFEAFTKCLRDWLERRCLPTAWVYAHECGRRVGLHTHMILYLPGEASPYRKEFRAWAKQ